MSLPTPVPGLVICYSYLWASEHTKGNEEGRKNRPCAIVAARQVIEGHEVITVVPVTHSPPTDPADAIEIPPTLKAHLGLDDLPSWIVVTEPMISYGPVPICGPCLAFSPAASTTECCHPVFSPMSATKSCKPICGGS